MSNIVFNKKFFFIKYHLTINRDNLFSLNICKILYKNYLNNTLILIKRFKFSKFLYTQYYFTLVLQTNQVTIHPKEVFKNLGRKISKPKPKILNTNSTNKVIQKVAVP